MLTFEKVEKTLQRLVKEIKDEAKQWVSAGAKQLAKIVATMSSKQFFSFALIYPVLLDQCYGCKAPLVPKLYFFL
jgi:hypothetical protein